MKVVFYFLLFASAVVSDPAGECDMYGFYMELGCSPISNTNESCPAAFQCPDLHPDPKLCYYRGVSYDNQDMIAQSKIENSCSQACTCSVGNIARFQCAVVDCVETFDTDTDQCIFTSELDSCCSTGTVCGKDDIAKLKTCEVDGQIFREGQMFYPQNTRKKCICTAQYNGSVDSSDCKDYDCGIEIHYQENIFEKCAPVFVSNSRSCPIAFECPTDKTKIIRGVNVEGVKGECAFGNLTMSVSDEVTVDEPCVTCACKVPPFVTCMKNTCSN